MDSEKEKIVRNVTVVGMLINILLTAGKFAAGIFGHSQALIADAVHSLSDLGTDLIVLVGVRFWSAPPDETHPYGHARIETIITAIIGVILAGAGISIAYDAVVHLRDKAMAPGIAALLVAVASIISKEILYQWTVAKGRKVQSSALEANAWHHRSDAISSIPAAIAIALSFFMPDMIFIDKIGAIIVSLFICYSAWEIIKTPLMELSDAGKPQVIETIRLISMTVPGVESVHRIRTRSSGQNIMVDLHVMVNPDLTVRQGHEIAENIHDKLRCSRFFIKDVVIHIEPSEQNHHDDDDDEGMAAVLPPRTNKDKKS